MDVSIVISIILGLPVAVLATLKIIDWWKKRRAGNRTFHDGEQGGEGSIIKEGEQLSPTVPADHAIEPIISQAEMATEAEKRIAEELLHYAANHRR